ncbi:MAG: hypothetical protein Q8S02_02310 [Hydrogenophaga sp.]|nr:hypothetical protein [Hydrogenophaga sp.]
MSWQDLALLVMVALAGSYGPYFMVLAFSRAPAPVMSPYLYLAIGFSALGDRWMFNHLTDAVALCDVLMIADFGMVAGWLNQQRNKP